MQLTQALSKKSTNILVRVVSMAGTGTTYNYVRKRTAPKVVHLRFDRKVGEKVLFAEQRKIRSLPEPFSVEPFVNIWKRRGK
ncbi:large ribosomal subunit protein bL33m-like isoform X2 [Styela clava]